MSSTATITDASPRIDDSIHFLADTSSTFRVQRQYPPVITFIDGPLPGRRRLVHPITIVIEFDDEEVVVSEPEFHMHASASTEEEAIVAFRRIFSGYLDVLTSRESRLDPYLCKQLAYLRSYISAE